MRRRLLVSYLAVTCGVLLVVLLPLGITYRGRQVDDGRAALQRQAFLISALTEDALENPANLDRTALSRSVGLVPRARGDRLVVVDRRGRTVVDNGSGALSPPLRALVVAAGRGRVGSILDGGRIVVAVPVASNGRVFGGVLVATSLQPIEQRTNRYWIDLAAIGGLALLVVVGTGIALARSVSRPLDQLRSVANELGDGDLTVRARTDAGPPEVRSPRVFNRTADRLGDLVRSEAEFVGDASHELRTPLTALRLRLENLASDVAARSVQAGADPSTAEDLDGALEEVERLSRLVDGLLALARAEGTIPDHAHEIDLQAIAEQRADAWQPLAQELDVAIVVTAGPPVPAAAHPDRVAQIVDNLVANALDATPAGGQVTIRCALATRTATIHVVDDGPGLSAPDRLRAFDRFWRGVRAEDPASALGGNGLGLAIVARLAAVDGGVVRLDEADGGGVDAVLELLRAAPARGHQR